MREVTALAFCVVIGAFAWGEHIYQRRRRVASSAREVGVGPCSSEQPARSTEPVRATVSSHTAWLMENRAPTSRADAPAPQSPEEARLRDAAREYLDLVMSWQPVSREPRVWKVMSR